jgi:hypothetical protein
MWNWDREQMTRALERAKVVRFLGTQRCPSELVSKTARMGKGKAAGFHSCVDGFAVCRAAPGRFDVSLDPNQIQILWPWILFLFLADDPTWDLDSPRVIG